MALSPAHARLFLGFIALALAGVEFTPIFLGRGLYEITFLGAHVGATTAITFLIIGFKSRRKGDETVPLNNVFDWALPLDLPVVVVPGADHFFHRRLHVIRDIITRAWRH